MHHFAFVLFATIFTWLILTARSKRRVAIVAVAGVLVASMVVVPPAAEAQVSLVQAIQAVLNVINGVIQAALSAISGVRTAISSMYQSLIWPIRLINLARS